MNYFMIAKTKEDEKAFICFAKTLKDIERFISIHSILPEFYICPMHCLDSDMLEEHYDYIVHKYHEIKLKGDFNIIAFMIK